MFVGHYGVSFAVKRAEPSIPLWVLFVAVQFLDVLWAPFVLLGIEKVRIVPGFTASSPLDLYYMPYTHSLVAALLWSAAGIVAYRLLARPRPTWSTAQWIGVAIFSHWVLDFLVHRRDLPLYDNTDKVGLGLWNYRTGAFALEIVVLWVGMWLYLAKAPVRRVPFVVFGMVMLVVHAFVFFGAPPSSPNAAAWTALAAYMFFALIAARLERGTRSKSVPRSGTQHFRRRIRIQK